MHMRDGATLSVVKNVAFSLDAGECAALGGPSGIGKSSILKMIFGNYRTDTGEILLRHEDAVVDIASADPRLILNVRRLTLGYVSQFLRCIPRVSALDVVTEASRENGVEEATALERSKELLDRLNVPERLWHLPPATFSGGEQQRINIARGFAAKRPILLLDEPTASLDATNRAVVIDLIEGAKKQGASVLGIFHDDDVRERVANHVIDVSRFAA